MLFQGNFGEGQLSGISGFSFFSSVSAAVLCMISVCELGKAE